MSTFSFITNPYATSSYSSSLCYKLSKAFSLEKPSLFSVQTHIFTPKPKLTLRFKTHFPSFSTSLSLNSSSFDGTQVAEAEAEADEEFVEEEEEEFVEEEEELEEDGEEESESESDLESGNEEIEVGSGEAGRLYVGNLPFAITSAQLSDIFGEAGNVVSVEVVYDKVTGRSRGFAFLTMGSVQEAKEAIRMFEGSQVGGRSVKVNFPEVPRGGEREVMQPKIRSAYQSFIDTPHKIYVGNLSWAVTSQELTEVFGDQRGLLSAKVIYDRNTGRSRGFGFATFASAEEAESALSNKNEVVVDGRPLRLHFAENTAAFSPRQRFSS